jgi:putative Ig domain-containing protein
MLEASSLRGLRSVANREAMQRRFRFLSARSGTVALAVSVLGASLLAACGGGDAASTDAAPAAATADVASSTTVLDFGAMLPGDAGAAGANPTFHLAPVLLDDPGDADAVDGSTSARLAPRQTVVPGLAGVSGPRPTVQAIGNLQRGLTVRTEAGIAPEASTSTVVTYTPAQIRAAYAMPALPVTGAAMTAAQAAQMGAGQTIYVVDAQNDPNAATELATFNQRFGLPACTTLSIAANATLPLTTAPFNGCNFAVVYATVSGGMTATAPAYNAGWATEIALDVQWAHATAPLARIVLIEAPDGSLNSLLAAVGLANAMGNGVVSMSFGSPEGNWTSSVDSAFTAANMTYVAATGDSGAGVSWPAVSQHVLGVGGTSLNAIGNGTRSESAWAGSGGGQSASTPRPSYQSSAVPGIGTGAWRNVADVSFNANPYTGQYLAVIATNGALSWLSAGGTSLAAPQWAGVLAIANAIRAQNGKAALGAPHSLLYGLAEVPGTYAADLLDISTGSDGSCSTCSAKVGYDTPTGLGTPTATGLFATLAGPAAPTPPVVTPATITGQAGTPLNFTANVSAPDSVTYGISNNPTGMAIASTGIVTWAAPVAGTYSVTIAATDTKTQLKGSAVYAVVIAAPVPPSVPSMTVNGQSGAALSFTVAVTAPHAVTLALTGAPSGMTISSAGAVAWPQPVVGSYHVTVTAKDTTTGLSAQGTETVTISALPPPVVTSRTVIGTAGTSLSFPIAFTAADPVTFSLAGAPTGMTISSAGLVTWALPAAGTYTVVATAKDTKSGASGSGTITVQIAPAGLSITAAAMSGVAGKPITGTITIVESGAAQWIELSLGGVPLGMTFSASGLTLTASWSNPMTGNYALQVYAIDSAGRSAQLSVPITVTAK